MRILHTSDWHIGKKIGRFDRHDEYREVIDEVVETAEGSRSTWWCTAGIYSTATSPPWRPSL